ncbi:hypothetical protein ACG2LH_17180 [Zhouia sp. PK063]|uniref:hypothetical protein n=1 Tax=Zhouia sp. PK063 TaxID=3373602 RepID=UPI00378B7751
MILNKKIKHIDKESPIYFWILAVSFIWIGYVASISFMEAWLKFRAPNITLSIGLEIGRLVFRALNGVEWCFALIILGLIRKVTSKTLFNNVSLFFFISLGILLLQTLWLLPKLDHRAIKIISGETPEKSFLHVCYIVFEVLKLVGLFSFNFKLFRKLY